MSKRLNAFFLAAALATGPAAAMTVNIDALNENGINLSMAAGDYQVSWIGRAQGGAYDAWSAWAGVDPQGVDHWLNSVLVSVDQGATAYYGTGTFPWYVSPADALAAAKDLSFHLHLSTPQSVNFKVADGPLGAFYNNRGGVSLNVAAVPEPETYALMLAGLGLVGFIARRRQTA